MIESLAALLVFQLVGEILVRWAGLLIPGPVIGMALLFAFLQMRKRPDVPLSLGRTADTLLGNLGLLFVPAGVGVMLYLPLLASAWLPILVAVVFGTLATAAVTGLVAQAVLKRFI